MKTLKHKNIKAELKIIGATFIILLAIPLISYAQFLTTNNDFPIDLLWKVESYTPAGYKGKALPVAGSIITLSAITPTQNPQNIEFSWLVKDYSSRIQGPEKRGVGDNSFTFVAEKNIINFTHKIKLEARNIITNKTATTRIEISIITPEVYLYTNQDGRWGQNINRQITGKPGKTLTILAKPFYFNVLGIENLDFSWSFDNKRIFDDIEPNILSLNISSQTTPGTKRNIRLKVENGQAKQFFKEQASASTNLLVLPQ